MTELQMGLLGLGGVAVVGVVAYNTWLEYKHRKLAQQLLQPAQDDVLLGQRQAHEADGELPDTTDETATTFDEVAAGDIRARGSDEDALRADEGRQPTLDTGRVEPSLGERIEPVLYREETVPEASSEADELVEEEIIEIGEASLPSGSDEVEALMHPLAPVQKTVLVTPAPDVVAVPMPVSVAMPVADEVRDVAEPIHLLVPSVDFIAALEAVEPATGEQIVAAQHEALSRIRKPIHWFGYNESTQEWDALGAETGVEYRSIRAGLQLVDRRGPVTEAELTVFNVAMQDLAHQLMAIMDIPQRPAALDAAARLDAFCADVDIQIGINVISTSSPFAGTKIRALAEAAGMVIDSCGRFVRADDDGNVLYVMLNQEAAGFSIEGMRTMTTHGLTFLLDVPTVAHGDRVFNQIVDLAKRFADVLKGAIVDDNRRPLSDGALEPIRRQIVQYQSSMAAQKLPAGSRLAKRLFS